MLNDIRLVKEGYGFTLYINDKMCGWGDFDDMTDELEDVIARCKSGESIEDITEDLCTFY